ncbi:MinD/ParA family ATP-binding protein [Luteimicrobium sp. DT211]|uniref:MinD/ParA family ATP-binding protein n=1 Tax=Luteimicrobium sp. DT211 TaxID=3393412 RepID=UPI003CF4551C
MVEGVPADVSPDPALVVDGPFRGQSVPVEPVPVDPGELLAAATPSAAAIRAQQPRPKARARQGLRGKLARAGLPVAPGAEEQAALDKAYAEQVRLEEAKRVIRQAAWPRAVAVLVGNRKGGAGKTTLSLTLGGQLSAIRGGNTALHEVADDPNDLAGRSEGSPLVGLGELVRDVDQLDAQGKVGWYASTQTSFADVIATVQGRARPALTYDAVTKVCRKLNEFYKVRVMDSGNQPTSGAFRAAVDNADVFVIPLMLEQPSCSHAVATLHALRSMGPHGAYLADTSVAVIMEDGRPVYGPMEQAVLETLAAAGVKTIHRLPYDEHIAMRGQTTLAEISQPTLDALTYAAADVIRAMTRAVAREELNASAPLPTSSFPTTPSSGDYVPEPFTAPAPEATLHWTRSPHHA